MSLHRKAKKLIRKTLSAVANPGAAKRDVLFLRARRANHKRRHEQYLAWYARYEQRELNPETLIEQKKAAKKFKKQPLISILVPTYNTNIKHLRECLDSVVHQTYAKWELCIADDASPRQEVRDVIKEYAKKHKNIKYVFSKKNQHIALTSNLALELASGDYISLLDHDDLLLPNALYETVKAINEHPDVDLFYTDEDKIEKDKWHVEPFFKPDWSPDFLRSCNYITHFATIKSSVMKKVGGFRIATEGAQDWDLFLRITAQTEKLWHIPKILYSWRKSETSTAQTSESKPYAYVNQKKVLRNGLAVANESGWVEAHPAMGFWRARYNIQGTPLVSIVIPTKDHYKLLSQCVNSVLEETTYPYFEVIITENGSTEKEVENYYQWVTERNANVRVVRWKKPFSYAAVCNFGAKHAKGDYIIFLNNDTQVMTPDWIQGLLEHAQRPGVGVVGCRLLFPNKRVQHAGVVLSERDIAYHPFYGIDPRADIFTYIYTDNVRNCSAVTAACCMLSRKNFNAVGGFDEALRVTYNDVDLCLKLLDRGLHNIYTPFVELFHHESMSIGKIAGGDRDRKEVKEAAGIMRKRWLKYLKRDPFYNDNFEQHGPGYRVISD
jgi:O-antigen biosynthesis protein